MRLIDELAEVVDRSVVGVNREEVRDVVAAVPKRGDVHRQQPDAVDAEPLQEVELVDQPAEVARPVVVAVEEPADVDLVEDGALEPDRFALEPGFRHCAPGSATPSAAHPQQMALPRAEPDVVPPDVP